MDQEAEETDESVIITPEELQRILDRASAEDVPTLVTALRHAHKMLEADRKAIELFDSLVDKLFDVYETRAEILRTLHGRDYALWEAVHFLREFREREQQLQGTVQPKTK